ncbi:hypothetical protein CGLO_09481 [Colletotrichum gloeosporioides Cg-14]|uniref:Uncharacterized protein n=1 Tax=Colletotrichum gloeosporioides (strain Cg-14) TaxID=1237896 RepID=T0KG21_COLGC|nr:hypothetical protein CGLO_09481 [Colletotrichum gloeosporioides Cg-14]
MPMGVMDAVLRIPGHCMQVNCYVSVGSKSLSESGQAHANTIITRNFVIWMDIPG